MKEAARHSVAARLSRGFARFTAARRASLDSRAATERHRAPPAGQGRKTSFSGCFYSHTGGGFSFMKKP